MRKTLLTVFILAAISFVQLALADEPYLPSWFWQPPVDQDVEVEVGYALPHVEINSSFEEAFLDGAWRLYLNQGCRIVGEKGSITSGVGTVLMGNTVHCIVDSAGFAPFAAHVVRLDSFITREIAVMLVGLGEVSFSQELKPSPAGDIFDVDNDRFTLVSTSPPYYQPVSSWLEAESVARRDAAFSVAVKRKSVGRTSDSNISRAVAEQTDVWVHSFRTIGRWIDPETSNRMVKVTFNGYPLNR